MNNPKQNEEKMRKMLKAWEDHAKDVSFGGMTLTQFQAATARPLDSRTRLKDFHDKTEAEINVRDNEDETWLPIGQMIVNAVLGHPDFGPDSPMIEAMGYVRKSERKSGLTRKTSSKTPAKT